jgi:hypothetical protein
VVADERDGYAGIDTGAAGRSEGQFPFAGPLQLAQNGTGDDKGLSWRDEACRGMWRVDRLVDPEGCGSALQLRMRISRLGYRKFKVSDKISIVRGFSKRDSSELCTGFYRRGL